MLAKLQDQEAHLKLINKQAKELSNALSPENAEKYQKQVSELERKRADCKKITEARLKRVNEAVLQTEELETAMKETLHWMDDVDKFLQEITGTIAEGDAETIKSQVQEVEVGSRTLRNSVQGIFYCYALVKWYFFNINLLQYVEKVCVVKL